MGWKEHHIKHGDGKGGLILKPAEYQLLHHSNGGCVFPFGLVQMENGEVVILCSWKSPDDEKERIVIAFSKDRGDTWSSLEEIAEAYNRPHVFAYLGKGKLTFQSEVHEDSSKNTRFFSSDHGRSWTERIPVQPAGDGKGWRNEGNPLVDRNKHAIATGIAEVGYSHIPDGYPRVPTRAFVRWSQDGGRTWSDEVSPEEWQWEEVFNGKRYRRGVSEGSLVRVKNGCIVAALRTDMRARYLEGPNNDSLEGTAISISKDDGKRWSPLQILCDAGRHHANLLLLPNGDIVMTLIVRVDVRVGKLASYRRGCEAVISHDNGLTWNLEHNYVLDDYEFFDGKAWFNGECGHLSSLSLDSGYILTAYGAYLTKGASLIRWKP